MIWRSAPLTTITMRQTTIDIPPRLIRPFEPGRLDQRTCVGFGCTMRTDFAS